MESNAHYAKREVARSGSYLSCRGEQVGLELAAGKYGGSLLLMERKNCHVSSTNSLSC